MAFEGGAAGLRNFVGEVIHHAVFESTIEENVDADVVDPVLLPALLRLVVDVVAFPGVGAVLTFPVFLHHAVFEDQFDFTVAGGDAALRCGHAQFAKPEVKIADSRRYRRRGADFSWLVRRAWRSADRCAARPDWDRRSGPQAARSLVARLSPGVRGLFPAASWRHTQRLRRIHRRARRRPHWPFQTPRVRPDICLAREKMHPAVTTRAAELPAIGRVHRRALQIWPSLWSHTQRQLEPRLC